MYMLLCESILALRNSGGRGLSCVCFVYLCGVLAGDFYGVLCLPHPGSSTGVWRQLSVLAQTKIDDETQGTLWVTHANRSESYPRILNCNPISDPLGKYHCK